MNNVLDLFDGIAFAFAVVLPAFGGAQIVNPLRIGEPLPRRLYITYIRPVDDDHAALVVKSDAVALRDMRWWRVLGWAALVVCVALVPIAMIVGFSVWFGLIGIVASTFALLSTDWRYGRRGGPAGELRLSGNVLEVRTRGLVHRYDVGAIRGGWVERTRDEDWMVLRLGSGHVVLLKLAPDDERVARRLLETSGADSMATAFSLSQSSTFGRLGVAALLVTSVLVGIPAIVMLLAFAAFLFCMGEPITSLVPLVFGVLAIFTLAVPLARLLPITMVIGRDGVVVRRFLRRRLFIRYDALDRIAAVEDRLRLTSAKGHVLLRSHGNLSTQTLADKIRQARDAYAQDKPRAAVSLLRRGAESVERWQTRIGSLLLEEGRYREPIADADELLLLVADPQVSPEERVASAFALSALSNVGVTRRLRLAVDGCAEPALRVALERAADGSLDAAALDKATAAHEEASASGPTPGL